MGPKKLNHGGPVHFYHSPMAISPQAARSEMCWGTERKKQRNSVKIKRPCFALA